MEEKIIKISAEINLTKKPEEIRVEGTSDVWNDLGIWLEVTSFIAFKAMKYREWNKEKMVEYCMNYFKESIGEVK